MTVAFLITLGVLVLTLAWGIYQARKPRYLFEVEWMDEDDEGEEEDLCFTLYGEHGGVMDN